MPALAFGLGAAKSKPQLGKTAPKRKGVFANDNENESNDEEESAFTKLKSNKSPKLSHSNGGNSKTGTSSNKYTNLSALRSAKLHDEAASQLDASVYDYDAVYDTFQANVNKKTADPESSGPKYMTSLMQSAETRKRDHLRAREKQLQRERENEGDEFADKEKFVTGAYKKAQEEMRQLEEVEKQKEIEEEERRRKGGGMEAFNRTLLQKEEDRQQAIEQAMEEIRRKRERGEITTPSNPDEARTPTRSTEAETAAAQGPGQNIITNDDGEVIDKRQLLGAGLNVAPAKPPSQVKPSHSHSHNGTTPHVSNQSQPQTNARQTQRERQTRLVERQIEEMTRTQRAAEEEQQREIEEKSKSKLSEEVKTSARERFLARKKEREEEEARRKAGGGG